MNEKIDWKAYVLGELTTAERDVAAERLKGDTGAREEIDRLQLTMAALATVRDEEVPRRIAFVSDKVFEPTWWQRFWASGPKLGFASAAILAGAILAHGYLTPQSQIVQTTPVPIVDTAAIEAKFDRRLDAAVKRVEAQSAQRVAVVLKEAAFDRRADRVSMEENFNLLRKQMNRMYVASNYAGGEPGGER